jgi:hypothetical protein
MATAQSNQFTSIASLAASRPSVSASAPSPAASPSDYASALGSGRSMSDIQATKPSFATSLGSGRSTSDIQSVKPAAAPSVSASSSPVSNSSNYGVGSGGATLGTAAKTPVISTQFSNISNNATSTATTSSPATNISGKVETTTPAQRAAQASDAKGFLGELTGIPAAERLATGNSPRVGGSFLPSGVAKAVGVGLDVASVLPVAGAVGKGLAAVGLLGKTAKTVGAADAALKGGKALKDVAGTKAAATLAAGAMTFGPTTGAVVDAAKTGTAITQSVGAAKRLSSAADTFAPTAAKASSKGASSVAKSVDSVPKKVSSTSFSASTKAKTAESVAKAKAASSVVTASKAPTAADEVTQTQVKANESKANTFKTESNKTGAKEDVVTKEDVTKVKAPEDVTKVKAPINTKYTKDNKDIFDQFTSNYNDPFKVIQEVKNPYNNESTGDGGGGEKPATKPEETAKRRRIPRLKINGKGRQWTPSSVV